MTTAEALGYKFKNGEKPPRLGREMPDEALKWIVAPENERSLNDVEVAELLLKHTVESRPAGGKLTRVPKPDDPPAQAAPVEKPKTAEQVAQDEWAWLKEQVAFQGRIIAALKDEVIRLQAKVQANTDAVGICTDASIRTAENMAKFVEKIVSATKAPPAPAKVSGAADGSFVTEKIEAKKEKGKLSFRVFGGPYTKFGVICWPETLEAAGLTPEKFPIGEEKPFKGWTASFINGDPGDDGKVWPRKIVSLTKGQQLAPPPPPDEWADF